jgi:hypothetical protein
MVAMRRVVGINLLIALFAVLTGGSVPIGHCPMHDGSGGGHHDGSHSGAHHKSAGDPSSPHGTDKAHSCTCAGECGRFGSGLGVPESGMVSVVLAQPQQAPAASDQSTGWRVVDRLPPATGPPEHLRI